MSKKKLSSFLWIEDFRPQSVKDILMPTKTKRYFNKLIKSGEIPHILLSSSSPGTGKTTTAKAICNDLNAVFIYINASMNGKIDTLRDTIKEFATSKSLDGRPKIVILDEIDSNSNINFQKALRGFMEEFHTSCRFILTCNYINNVIKPLRSRCEVTDYNMTEKDIVEEMKPKMVKRLLGMLKFKEVEYEEGVIEKLVDLNYPDFREMVKSLDQFQKTYDIISNDIFSVQMLDDEFYEYILTAKFPKIREYVVQRNLNYDELYTNLYSNLIPRLKSNVRGNAIIILNEGQRGTSQVANEELNFMATIYELLSDCIINQGGDE
jgi:DNA polymerase III delta prime subunit